MGEATSGPGVGPWLCMVLTGRAPVSVFWESLPPGGAGSSCAASGSIQAGAGGRLSLQMWSGSPGFAGVAPVLHSSLMLSVLPAVLELTHLFQI